MALFFEWGEGRGLVLHHSTMPGPFWRVWLKSSDRQHGFLLGVGGRRLRTGLFFITELRLVLIRESDLNPL